MVHLKKPSKRSATLIKSSDRPKALLVNILVMEESIKDFSVPGQSRFGDFSDRFGSVQNRIQNVGSESDPDRYGLDRMGSQRVSKNDFLTLLHF